MSFIANRGRSSEVANVASEEASSSFSVGHQVHHVDSVEEDCLGLEISLRQLESVLVDLVVIVTETVEFLPHLRALRGSKWCLAFRVILAPDSVSVGVPAAALC